MRASGVRPLRVRAATVTALSLGAALGAALGSGPVAGQAAPPLNERFDFENPRASPELPRALEEISGLATDADGSLFAHDDEQAVVHSLDPETGRSLRRFALGRPPAPGDFEGIAFVDARLFLVTSGGWLYETRDVGDGRQAPYRVTDTGLGAGCEVEGLAYDAAGGSLLLACKTVPGRGNAVVVHRLPLDPTRPRPEPVRIPWSAFAAFGVDPEVHPSAIEVDPTTGGWVLLAARERLVFEVDPSGRLRSVVELPRRRHRQPEGIAFLRDGALVIADEGTGGRAHLTVYRAATSR